jgi:hypothetical protein
VLQAAVTERDHCKPVIIPFAIRTRLPWLIVHTGMRVVGHVMAAIQLVAQRRELVNFPAVARESAGRLESVSQVALLFQTSKGPVIPLA